MTWLVWDHADDLPPTASRSSQFSAKVDSTIDLLDRELHSLGAAKATIESSHIPGERLRDGRPANRGSAIFGAVRVSAETKHGRLTWLAARYQRWEDNLRAIALTLENLRAIDRYGATSGEQYAGFKALPAGDGGKRARQILTEAAGLNPDAQGMSDDQLARRAIRATHPDAPGGSRDRFDAVLDASRELGIRP